MKCEQCPMLIEEWSYFQEDCDCYCKLGADIYEKESCSRSESYVFSEKAKLKSEKIEKEKYSDMADWLEGLMEEEHEEI